MNEAEWLASEDPVAMLHAVGETNGDHPDRAFYGQAPYRASDRKLRLFACACCRQVWDRLVDDVQCPTCHGGGKDWQGSIKDPCRDCGGTGRINRSRRAVETAERFADGEATEEELSAAWSPAWKAAQALLGRGGTYARDYNDRDYTAAWYAARLAAAYQRADVLTSALQALNAAPLAAGAALLRDVVGNPWRPVARWNVVLEGLKGGTDRSPGDFDERWLTRTVLALAQDAYYRREEQVCGRCPPEGAPESVRLNHARYGHAGALLLNPVTLALLADALEEAGCVLETVSKARKGAISDGGEAEGQGDEPAGNWVQHTPHPLLAHLRGPGPHVRGCWAVDLLLGKS